MQVAQAYEKAAASGERADEDVIGAATYEKFKAGEGRVRAAGHDQAADELANLRGRFQKHRDAVDAARGPSHQALVERKEQAEDITWGGLILAALSGFWILKRWDT